VYYFFRKEAKIFLHFSKKKLFQSFSVLYLYLEVFDWILNNSESILKLYVIIIPQNIKMLHGTH
jgi:hypothetical protein